MITLNFKTIEEIILPDHRIRDLLPEFRDLFLSWGMSRRVPSMRALGKKAAIDLLSSLKPQHVALIQEYFNDSVVVEKLESSLVFHVDIDENAIDSFPDQFLGFAVTRDAGGSSVTFWR